MATASLRALLAGSIDYAGLFPPASLALEPALRNQAEYVRSPDAWMLGAFILPVGKFEDAAAHLVRFDVQHSLSISALGPKTNNAVEFIEELNIGADRIRDFEARFRPTATVGQIEMALPSEPGASLGETNRALAGLDVPTFWEANVDEAERTIAFVAERRATGAGRYGFKLRTGGVIASAFPSSIQIARALVAAALHRVPIKFTAGLHHPVRQFHPSVQTKMHGFLNVLGAGILAAEHRWDVQQTAAMLEDEDASAFVFSENEFAWREWKIATAKIASGRKMITSFGSCSFDEPREDLRALHLF
ncbi:MAG: hypothetical protein ACR2HH_16315 [Chthoniobacterales bacterium]